MTSAWSPSCDASLRACSLVDVRENPVQLVEAVITDDELAAARRRVLQLDRRAELVGEVVLEPLDVRILRAALSGLVLAVARVRDEAPHERFRLADGESFLRDQRADFRLLPRRREREQRARVAHLELALLDQRADGLWEVEEPKEVRYGGAGAADRFRCLLVRELEFEDQA